MKCFNSRSKIMLGKGGNIMSSQQRFKQQLNFLAEIDSLKEIYRKTKLNTGDRFENDAEHSWELAMMAVVLQEYAEEELDLSRVIKMLLIHDLVEIDAGDTFVYDEEAVQDQEEREQAAAERIFGLLPSDQEQELRTLWYEFEEEQTAEARFALALDRMQPIIHNFYNQGGTWQEFSINREQVEEKNKKIDFGSSQLWKFTQEILDTAQKQGYLD
ncbi:metal dependent phosphohydrolase [Natranaerobius thermophilus JW/NM-WN-LF]|uniref:Metal dependent phosphohydrolase n=2 Tax=Natranaerobius TaxID=375928 RepID=B2A6P1_NATTJ|nr:metal dependent phosphohydrolase [Natranaerobius thermophilus JW/NM-WN-LF]